MGSIMLEQAPLRDLPKNVIMPASWIKWITNVWMLVSSINDSGTANPTANLWVGRRFFRTDLGIPVYCSSVSGTWKKYSDNTVVP